ncbi:helix-turn-helix domain-containing protein [Acetobacter persici]|nr:helix-turn-helix domain-containing protein [Acetobacter persici]
MLTDPRCRAGATITLPAFMTVPEAAMAVRCHPETLRRAIRDGRLAAWRRRRCTLVSPEALMAYLEGFLCPASASKSLISNSVAASTTSSGGMPENAIAFQRAQRMKRRVGAL